MKKYILSLALISFSISLLSQTKYFVTPEGNDGNDGLSWENPKTLNGILTSNNLVDGDRVFVKKGTYTAPENGSFTCNKAAIFVYGNCEGTETEKPVYDINNVETYLIGSGRRVFYFSTASTITGFDISGGNAYNSTAGASGRGGGAYVDNVDGKMEYCIIHNNVGAGTNVTTISGVGGGVYALGTLENCIIKDNVGAEGPSTKRGVGGGIRLDGGNLINCIVTGNRTVTNDNAVGTGNNLGGGVSTTGGYIVNCLIADNTTGGPENNNNFGGGIDVTLATTAAKPVYIINSTIVGNSSTGRGGGIGIKTENNHMQVKNCILWNNVARSTQASSNNISPMIATTSIQYSLWLEATDGNTDYNLNADPLFVAGTYTLQLASPAIDAGDNNAITYAKDLAGNDRIVGNLVDLGAYEYSPTGSVFVPDEVKADDSLIEIQYYALSGLQVPEPVHSGIYIVKKIYASGKTEIIKSIIQIY